MAVVVLMAATACGGSTGGSGEVSCGPVEQFLEPNSQVHVLSADAAHYQHHPPTSGPHLPSKPEAGVRATPLPEAEQVSALEGGFVIFQYSPAVSPNGVDALRTVAQGRDDVIVMPAATPIDGGKPVAFTAWGERQRCDGVSVDAARRFIDAFVGKGAPGSN